MFSREKKRELQSYVENNIKQLIDRDYVLLSLPCHSNIGDTLIYEGEKDFLKNISFRCVFKSSTYDYFDINIPQDVLILFHGGGNFGDIYDIESEFKNRIISKYPKNKIVFFPQTVFYQSENNLKSDAELYGKCKDLTICARDKFSYEILRKNFSNKVILAPDMAFCIDSARLISKEVVGKSLFLKRTDGEIYSGFGYTEIPADVDVHDWPTREYTSPCYWLDNYVRHAVSIVTYLLGKKKHDSIMCKYKNYIWERFIFPYNVTTGIQFINRYDTIYTTRLHGAILSLLLNKKVILYDNSYGKNSSFYLTWLEDVDNIRLITSDNIRK